MKDETIKPQFESKWWYLLNHCFKEDYIYNIFLKIRERVSSGEEIFPLKKECFKQFNLCKYDDVLVCFIHEQPIINYKQSKFFRSLSEKFFF